MRRLLFFRTPWTPLALGATFTIRSARSARTTGTTGTTGTTTTRRSSRSEFFLGEFAVTILVEFQQGRCGILDFVGIQKAVMILIEGFHQWGDHPRPSIRTARTAGRLGAIFVLGDGGESCASQRQCQ